MKKLRIFFLLITSQALMHQALYAQSSEQAKIDSILILIAGAKEDTNKVTLFVEVMTYHIYYKQSEGLKYEMPALKLAEKLNWQPGQYHVKQVAGKIYWRMNKFDAALNNHFAALSIAEKLKNKKLFAATLGAIGQDYGDNANYPEALKYFNKGLNAAREAGDMKRTASLYNLISWAYEQQGNYPEAIKTNFEVLKLSQEQGNIDLETVTMANIGESYMALGNDSIALLYLNSAIDKREKYSSQLIVDKILISNSYISVGSIYQKRNDFLEALNYFKLALKTGKEINDIGTIRNAYSHLGELYAIRENNTEALKMYLMAVEASISLKDNQVTAELLFAVGGCYTRLHQYAEAKKYFEDARVLLQKTQNESLGYLYYEGVELIDSATGNWKDAYVHYKSSVRLKNKLNNDENAKKILQTIMQLEFNIKEEATKAEQERKDIIQRTIRNSIAVTLAGSLLFLIILYNQRNKISKARKRSDELLLNILPADVAEELKSNGSAEARQFNEITVMFTDFKGFTRLSELLTPSELVAEIHTCFKAFDNIIGKYNIEKIKTIGDAYMAAGGLPVANSTHAKDVVNAALEIRNFMQQHIKDRQKENKPLFEIRIGVHTGPVVAGIVGVKKFAYDIWGDTVNIASRMESSGEEGKVNISGRVYELVKDQFTCTYRGKIQAKNKGEIDMYFVEG